MPFMKQNQAQQLGYLPLKSCHCAHSTLPLVINNVKKAPEGTMLHWHRVMSSARGSAKNIGNLRNRKSFIDRCFPWAFRKGDAWCVLSEHRQIFRKPSCGSVQLFFKFLFASHPLVSIFSSFSSSESSGKRGRMPWRLRPLQGLSLQQHCPSGVRAPFGTVKLGETRQRGGE